MESRLLNELIEVEQGYMFYCNNCSSKFTFVYSFYPIPRLTSYYVCFNCNSILPIKDLKKKKMNNFIEYISYYCCYLCAK